MDKIVPFQKKHITKNNLETLYYFDEARRAKNPLNKIRNYLNSGVYRQSKLDNMVLIIGLLLNKI